MNVLLQIGVGKQVLGKYFQKLVKFISLLEDIPNLLFFKIKFEAGLLLLPGARDARDSILNSNKSVKS